MLIARFGFTIVGRQWGLPVPRSMRQARAAHRFVSLLALLLTGTILFAVGGMLAWHTYLVLTAQGTIDFQKNRDSAAKAAHYGYTWRNVHDLGPARNWQERFDVRGRLWAVAWLLPRLARHRGSGAQLPLAAGADSYISNGQNV